MAQISLVPRNPGFQRPRVEGSPFKSLTVPVKLWFLQSPGEWSLNKGVSSEPRFLYLDSDYRKRNKQRRVLLASERRYELVFKHFLYEPSTHLDPWKVRDEFIAVKGDEEIIPFLNKTGRFADGFVDEVGREWYPIDEPGPMASISDFREWQKLIRVLVTREPDAWTDLEGRFDKRKLKLIEVNNNLLGGTNQLSLRFDWEAGEYSLVLQASYTISAMLGAIQIDHLSGAEFSTCAKPDCGNFYRITSKHRRLYCSPYCAHHESIRRTRAKKRASKDS